MNLLRLLLLVLTAGVALTVPADSKAGFAPIVYDKTGALTAVPHKTIRLDSEQVIIRVKPDNYMVDSVCCFFNTGETIKQLIGFPKPERKYGSPGSDFEAIETWIDGRKMSFSEGSNHLTRLGRDVRPLGPPSRLRAKSGWMVGEVTFPRHTTTVIRVKYKAPYASGVGTNNVYYSLGIGRFWKDKIGKGFFTIDGTGVGGMKHILTTEYFPLWVAPMALGANLVTYEISNYEPFPKGRLEAQVSRGSRREHFHYYKKLPSEITEGDVLEKLPAKSSQPLKTLKGKVLSSLPTALEIQVTENGANRGVLVKIAPAPRTRLIPFRRPLVGETVEVVYRDENGGKFAHVVRIIDR